MAFPQALHTLDHIAPGLNLKISKRARRMALRLDSASRTVNLVVPERFSIRKAEAFALAHREWIGAKLATLPAPVGFENGAVIPVLGQDRVLEICYDSTLKKTNIILDKNNIIVFTNQGDPAPRIARFLRNEALDTFTNLAREKAAGIGQSVNTVQVRNTKSRWGSCAPDGRLSFSWRLVFAPWEAMDYVVAHEVAHLVHMNHSKRFWALCADLSEDYSTGKKWMRTHGHSLMRYGQDVSSYRSP